MLRPLQNRVIIKPDAQPEAIDSGLILVQDRRQPEMGGEVIAVGHGPAAAHRVRTSTIGECIRILNEVAERTPTSALRAEAEDALARYLMSTVELAEVQVGDQVCFPYTAGQKLQVDGETYLLLNEDDIAAVWTPDEAVA